MAGNKGLHVAKTAKNDEFYTKLSDIEKELSHYPEKFRGKTVFCNCDDPFESNFVKFFLMHFNGYGLKALYATGYKISSIVNTEVKVKKIPYSLCVTDTNKYLKGDQKDLDIKSAKEFIQAEESRVMTPLYGDDNYVAGDFRSKESIEILKKCDIVVTNPPFSLFREYVAQLLKYEKDFIIIGNQNAITYKEIFSLIKEDKLWLGPSIHNGDREFMVPPDYNISSNCRFDEHGQKYISVRGPRWFTNIDHNERHIKMPLDMAYKYYGYEENYPKYDNFDAININKTATIPVDFSGVMGVPITFLDKYCPEQFEIIGEMASSNPKYFQYGAPKIKGKKVYARILIRRKDMGKE